MKAKVKATGEILEVYKSCTEDFPWTDEMGDKIWKTEELIFLKDTENNPDYWTRLEHQYAGMAMQGMIRTVGHDRMYPPEKIAIYAEACAHALVQKLKEKEEK